MRKGGKKKMKRKIVGICVCMLVLGATVLSTTATTEKYIGSNMKNSYTSIKVNTMMVDHGKILDQNLDSQGQGYTVLRVWGSFYEMGYARAELLGDSIVQELNLVKAFFGPDYIYYKDIINGAVYPSDVENEINGMVDSLALTHPEENISELDIKMICDAWTCYIDFGCRSHTCWGRYVTEPIKTLSTRRLDLSQTFPIPRHHVLCAHVPDGSPRWVSLDTPGFVGTWSSVNEYGTLVSCHAWIPFKCNLSSGRMGMASIRHALTYATDSDISTHLDTVYEELQHNESMLNGFVNYYAPQGYGGVIACDPSQSGPDCFDLRRPNETWHHGEAMITTNKFTNGTTTPPDEDFDVDEYYDNETLKTMESHWGILADNPPGYPLVNYHMMSVACRSHGGMTIWADGLIQGNTRTPRLEYEWSELFETPELQIISLSGGFGVKAGITNNGFVNATNINWTFTLTGGFIMLGQTKSGTITSLSPGMSITVKDIPVIGFGKTIIKLEATCAEKSSIAQTKIGTVILFFVIGVK